VVTRIQSIVEHHRRLGHVCERAAFDLYRECELVLASLKSCERVVTTPIPFQYLQMSNFVTFFFTYSAPFIFTVSYQYISFFPACLLAMAFYGINSVGEVIERPFNWREPNHDLTGVGLRVWRECVQIHRRCASRDAETLSAHGVTDVAESEPFVAFEELARRAAEPPDVENVLASSKELRRNFRSRRASAVVMANELASREYPRHTFSFLTGLFDGSNETLRRVVPQVLLAAAIGAVANWAKVHMCGADVKLSSECSVTFHTEAHAICGAIIGFLLVFCANIAYLRYYEARSAVGDIYHGLRNMNIEFASFLRAPIAGEPGHVPAKGTDLPDDAASIKDDQLELRRLSNVLFAFIRQALREHRHGYRFDARSRGDEKGVGDGKLGFLRRMFKPGKAATFGGGTGPVSEASLLDQDLCGEPSLTTLLTDEERVRYADVPVGNRFNVCVAEIQRVVARNQREGDLYEKAAYDVYKECDRVLSAFKTCERIVTTPIPYQYVHMVNLVLFFFVFSAPLVFTVTFKRLTPLPSGILALGFYGIWEVGRSMMDPFDWIEPCVNLTAIGRRISTEAQRITDAGRKRHSVFANGGKVGVAERIARRKPTAFVRR
jgi:predicted membrane chloride channel (bestrophin family)